MKTIIEMAREAGFNTNHEMIWINKWEVSPYMQRFAALVRADEREAMVAASAKKGWAMRGEDPFEDCVREIADIRARGNT